MNFGNIAVDGYGLHSVEVPNVAVSGYGFGIPLFIPPIVLPPPVSEIIQQRIYEDMERALLNLDRSLLSGLSRELDAIGRVYINESRFQAATNRIYADIDKALNDIDRVLVSSSRSMTSTERDLR